MGSSGRFLPAGEVEEEAEHQADDRRADPAEADAGERQDIAHGFDQAVQMQQGAEIFGEVAEQVVDGADECQDQGGDVDLPAVAKELAEEGQQDQGDGQGIEEHQHGHGVADDGAQAQVGKDEGHEAEHDGPDPVRGPLGEEADEGLATAGDEGHGGFQAGQGDGGGQDQQTHAAQVVLGDLGQGDAAVFGGGEQAAALRPHDGDGQIDDGHEQAAENAGANGAAGHVLRFLHPQALDDLHHDDAEGQTGQGVHGVVALQKARQEGLGGVVPHGLHRGDGRAGGDQSNDQQDAQEEQEAGVQNFTDPGQNFSRPQGEEKRYGKEDRREQQQEKLGVALW